MAQVHVGMCADTGQVAVSALTSNQASGDTAMVSMIGALEGTPLGDVFGDGHMTQWIVALKNYSQKFTCVSSMACDCSLA